MNISEILENIGKTSEARKLALNRKEEVATIHKNGRVVCFCDILINLDTYGYKRNYYDQKGYRGGTRNNTKKKINMVGLRL